MERYEQLDQQGVEDGIAAVGLDLEEEIKEIRNPATLSWLNCNEEQLRTLTGFTQLQFDDLLALLHPHLLPRCVGRRGRRAKKAATPEERLFMFLFWLRFNEPWKRMAASFGMSRTYIQGTVMSILKNVAPVLSQEYIKPYTHRTATTRLNLWHLSSL